MCHSATSQYRATLGHKANHSFRPNAKYDLFSAHPVLGLIMGIRALVDIPAGVEVLANYHYSPDVYEALGLQLVDKLCLKVRNIRDLMIGLNIILFQGQCSDVGQVL